MKQPTPEQLLDIARAHFSNNMTTLKARNSDGLDFYNVAVWNIEAALTAAYELGAREATEQTQE